ncbi:MAG: DNA polymerase III subunit delta [Gordonia sp. (in: high G+C Gram-positive bacteria)]
MIGRVVDAVVAQRSAASGQEVPVTRVRAGEVTAPELAELLSPSLFAEERVVVVESAAEAGKQPAGLIAAAARELPEGITLLVAHTGGGRARSLAGDLRRAGAVEQDCATPKWPSDRMKFVRNEFRTLGVRPANAAVELVVETVGSELRELAAACAQLVADTGGRVDADAVRRYYQGRPEVTGFEVADKTVAGDRAGALESLAWALHHGVAPVLLADALAESLHALARAHALGTTDPARAAAELKMPPWRVKNVLAQARGWDAPSIAAAVVVAATLNGEVKGQAADIAFALTAAVGRVADLRPTGRRRAG